MGNTMTEPVEKSTARRAAWRGRRRRFATGANVAGAMALACILAVMANYLSSRYYRRWNISRAGYFTLSDKTKKLLSGLEGDVAVVSCFEHNHEFFQDIKALLREYEYFAESVPALRFNLDVLDPSRDLVRVRRLKEKYGLTASNLVVFEYDGRRRYVEEARIIDYQRVVKLRELLAGEPSVERRRVGFRGEQAFSSAIHSIVQESRPVVYWATGHGERQLDDFSRQSGYSSIARSIRRDNVELRKLVLAQLQYVPADCAALLIAGPRRKFSVPELELLSEYLQGDGRILLFIDAGTDAGLDGLVERWGVKLGHGVVLGPSMTGRDLLVTEYGSHDITRPLRNVVTMFFEPRATEPVDGVSSSEDSSADRPRVTVLAANTEGYWEEMDPGESPARFDPDTDRRGPIAIAVAVEKGPVKDVALEIKPTRMVVVGDSDFVSNGALATGVGGNEDFFMGALNWLLERDELLGIGPKTPGELRLNMSARRTAQAYLVVVVAGPLAAALFGFGVWLRRRA